MNELLIIPAAICIIIAIDYLTGTNIIFQRTYPCQKKDFKIGDIDIKTKYKFTDGFQGPRITLTKESTGQKLSFWGEEIHQVEGVILIKGISHQCLGYSGDVFIMKDTFRVIRIDSRVSVCSFKYYKNKDLFEISHYVGKTYVANGVHSIIFDKEENIPEHKDWCLLREICTHTTNGRRTLSDYTFFNKVTGEQKGWFECRNDVDTSILLKT